MVRHKPPSVEGGGFAVGEDGGRDTTTPQSPLRGDSSPDKGSLWRMEVGGWEKDGTTNEEKCGIIVSSKKGKQGSALGGLT